MAATVTANLTDITLGEAADDADWTGEDGNSTEVFRQGSASQAWIVGKNSNETAVFDAFANNGAVFDLSATGTHLYITMKCDIAPYIDKLRFALQSDTAHGSSTSGTTWWTVVDNTTNIEWYGEWYTFVLDVNSTATDADSTGTLDLSAITDVHINVDNSNSGNIRSIENTYIDGIRFGTGLTITGTAWDWADVAAIDANSSNKWDIIQQVGPGVFRVQGQLKIGNGATTTTPSSSNETIYFLDPSSAGAAGGALGKLASAFYDVTIQGSGCTVDFNNVSMLAGTNTPFTIDASDTNLPTSSVDWAGGTILGGGGISLKSSQSYKNMSFVGCGQIDPSTSTFENNTISDYIGTEGGALLWPGGTTVKNCSFINCDQGIEITQTSNQTFDNLIFDDAAGNFDVHLNNGGTSINVSKNNGSNPNSYTATGGGVVTFVGASVTVKAKVVTDAGVNIQNARVFVRTAAAGSLPYNASVSISNSGTTATVTHTAHGLSNGDKIAVYGAATDDNLGVHTITVTGANTYTFTTAGTNSGSDAGSPTVYFVYLSGLTDVNGEISTSRVFPSDQACVGSARKSTSAPFYKQGSITGTVSSTANTTLSAVMTSDD